jgi:hypothetical protein
MLFNGAAPRAFNELRADAKLGWMAARGAPQKMALQSEDTVL